MVEQLCNYTKNCSILYLKHTCFKVVYGNTVCKLYLNEVLEIDKWGKHLI